MSKLDRSLTNIDWLTSFSRDRQPIKKPSHYCGNCLHCSRLKTRPKCSPTSPKKMHPSPPRTPNKPSHSYAQIIATAIKLSTSQRMTLNEIYTSILNTYPYYKSTNSGWKVAINRIVPINRNVAINRLF